MRRATSPKARPRVPAKLVHGGLRYLEYYEFRLVREALIEREVLLESAPHIIWPMRFVLPHSPLDRPAWLLRLGLFLYDHLGGRKRLPGTRSLDLTRDPEGAVVKDAFRKGFEYSDCWVDDSRLVVLCAVDAQERGAEVLTRTACTSARRDDGAWLIEMADATTGKRRTVRAKALVNAAGPLGERRDRPGHRQQIPAAGSGWSRAATSWCRSSGRASRPIWCRTPTGG